MSSTRSLWLRLLPIVGASAVLAAALLASLILAARMLSRMAIGAGPALAAFAAFSIATVGAVLPWLLMYFVW